MPLITVTTLDKLVWDWVKEEIANPAILAAIEERFEANSPIS
jgi:hypothetical protein